MTHVLRTYPKCHNFFYNLIPLKTHQRILWCEEKICFLMEMNFNLKISFLSSTEKKYFVMYSIWIIYSVIFMNYVNKFINFFGSRIFFMLTQKKLCWIKNNLWGFLKMILRYFYCWYVNLNISHELIHWSKFILIIL